MPPQWRLRRRLHRRLGMIRNGSVAGSGSSRLPATITANGRTRLVSRHARDDAHIGITAEIIEHVLENWEIRGVKTDSDGRQSLCYWAFVYGLEKMVRVAVSMDDTTIITAFRDSPATRKWRKLDISYFDRKYRRLEVRDAS